MGECCPPTAADYANHNANESLQKTKELLEKMATFQTQLEALTKQVRILEGKIATMTYNTSTKFRGV